MKVQIVVEIGINHNGDLDFCKKIIDSAVLAGNKNRELLPSEAEKLNSLRG